MIKSARHKLINKVLTWLACIKYLQENQGYNFSKGDFGMQVSIHGESSYSKI